MALRSSSIIGRILKLSNLQNKDTVCSWNWRSYFQRPQHTKSYPRFCFQNLKLNRPTVNCVSSLSQNCEMSTAHDGKTAGIIIIGDEILKGQVLDTNSLYLATELYSLGIKLCRISTIPDELSTIASEVSSFSSNFDYVFTTGGIGPTHDDITYTGVANAFNQAAEVNDEMLRVLEKWLSGKGYDAELIRKMARLPSNARLLFDPNTVNSFPIVIVGNVYIFPGIPQYVRKMFPRLRHDLAVAQFYTRKLYIDDVEMNIAMQLNQVVDKFKDQVTFGSYPVLDNLYYSTRITMESKDNESLEAAHDFFTKLLPASSLVEYDEDPVATAATKVYGIVNDESHPLHGAVSIAVKKLEEAWNRYGPDEICICFNGGKDCTALLHLLHAVVQKHKPENETSTKLKVLSIKYSNPFPEMEDFIHLTMSRYNLNVWTYEGPIHSGLTAAIKDHSEVKAVLMGTRRTDPSGHALDYFQMTDPTWPQVMRVSPMLDWTYTEVWTFLRTLTLPYCAIYDRGYTSIGSQSNTSPNEALKTVNSAGEVTYYPAYCLDDSTTERSGRE